MPQDLTQDLFDASRLAARLTRCFKTRHKTHLMRQDVFDASRLTRCFRANTMLEDLRNASRLNAMPQGLTQDLFDASRLTQRLKA
eukprot:2424868-Pyramimonas_sp.AAC.1